MPFPRSLLRLYIRRTIESTPSRRRLSAFIHPIQRASTPRVKRHLSSSPPLPSLVTRIVTPASRRSFPLRPLLTPNRHSHSSARVSLRRKRTRLLILCPYYPSFPAFASRITRLQSSGRRSCQRHSMAKGKALGEDNSGSNELAGSSASAYTHADSLYTDPYCQLIQPFFTHTLNANLFILLTCRVQKSFMSHEDSQVVQRKVTSACLCSAVAPPSTSSAPFRLRSRYSVSRT